MGHNSEHIYVDPGPAGSTAGDPIHPSWVSPPPPAGSVAEALLRVFPDDRPDEDVVTLGERYLAFLGMHDADRDCSEAAEALREAADRLDPSVVLVDSRMLIDLYKSSERLWAAITSLDDEIAEEVLTAFEETLDATEDWLKAVGLLPTAPEPEVGATEDRRAAA